LAVDHRISVNRVLTKDVALVVVYVYCQAVFFGLAPQRSTEYVVLVEWVSTWVLLADEAFICVLL
jgi:hypothetical protein